MALYKYKGYLDMNNDQIFDAITQPSYPAPRSGIYRCEGCGRECSSTEGLPLPPQNHHQHTPSQGTIRWRLIVYADHRPK
jgi:hypothetical protein